MQRRLQSLVALCVFVMGVVLLVLASPSLVGEQAPADLPRVDKLAHKGYTEVIKGVENDAKDLEAKFDLVPIPGGEFVMGSPANEPGRAADEGPQHPVRIRPFWMGKCEVTWDEFDIYRKEKGVESPEDNEKRIKDNADAITGPTPPYVDETYGHGREKHPALCMTHHHALVYCRWLSEKNGKPCGLPTEREWEWAARAGTKTAYFFGDDPTKLGDYAWYAKNSEDLTHEVGTKKPNPWGLYDIYGNVTEWCLDHYKKDYYATFPKDRLTLGPVLLPTADRFPHVVRGGSWADEPNRCRSAARRGSDKSWIKHDPQRPQSVWWLTKSDFVGFRVVRAVEEQDNLKNLRSKVTRASK